MLDAQKLVAIAYDVQYSATVTWKNWKEQKSAFMLSVFCVNNYRVRRKEVPGTW